MKTVKKFSRLAAVSLLMMGVGGLVWGQKQEFLPIGDDPLNPILDPFLLQHAWYADDTIIASGWNYTLPTNAISGTAGGCGLGGTLNLGGGGKCNNTTDSSKYFIQRFGSSGNIKLGINSKLSYGSNNGRSIDPIAQSSQTSNVYPTKPKFPKADAEFFNKLFQGKQLTNMMWEQNSVHTLSGVYYTESFKFNGSGNVKINIKPGKTIIYVRGNVSDDGQGNEIRLVNDDGSLVLASDMCDAEKMKNWNLVFIVGGNVDFKSGSTKALGTFIAPYGTISTGSGDIEYNGQILANALSFSNSYDAQSNMRYIPFTVTNIGISVTPESKEFKREQSCSAQLDLDTAIWVKLSKPLNNNDLSVNYTISNGTAAGHFVVSGSSPLKISKGQDSAAIFLKIKRDGNWYNDMTFTVDFTGYTLTPQPAANEKIDIDYPSSVTMTIKMEGTQQTKPNKPTFTPVTNSPIEYTLNPAANQTQHGAGQTVAVLSGGASYEITQNDNNGVNWFRINGDKIETTQDYRGNYDTGVRSMKIKVVAVNTNNTLDCFKKSEELEIPITIYPWNNKAFVIKAAISKNVDERGTFYVDPKEVNGWFTSDDDKDDDKNIWKHVGLTADNALSVGVWRNAASNTLNKTHQTALTPKAAVSIESDGRVLYSQSGFTDKVTSLTDFFYITARDSAAYAYSTDWYDKSVRVDVNIKNGNFFPPEPQVKNISVCKYGGFDISIGDITITDKDNIPGQPSLTNNFNGSPSCNLGAHGAKVEIIGGKLVYKAPDNPAYDDASDVITYTVTDGKNTGTGKINVTINPVKDKKPVAKPGEVEAFIGDETETRSFGGDWDNPNVLYVRGDGSLFVKELKVGDAAKNAGISVKVSDFVKGVFVITVPAGDISSFTGDYYFEYSIVDRKSYPVCADRDSVSNLAKVKIIIKEPNDNAAIPVHDTIVVNKGEIATTLWNGVNSVIDNDLPSVAGASPSYVVLEGFDNNRGSGVELYSSGTFKYIDNGGESPFYDEFTYRLYTASDVPSDKVGKVAVIVNPLNTNDPALTPKTGGVNAGVEKVFKVIDGEDGDIDWATILKLDRNASIVPNNTNALVDIVGDSAISFKYNGAITDTTTVVVTFYVNDSVNYKHHYNKDGVLSDDSTYIDFGSHQNTLTIKVVPNPIAVDYKMTVWEFNETNILLFKEKDTCYSVKDKILFLENVETYSFAIGDSTKNGDLIFDKITGTALYKNKNTAGLVDSFSYKLIYTLPGGVKDSTTGKVIISVLETAPEPNGDGSFYEDADGDGKVDKITIPFNRKLGFEVLLNTEFEIYFAGETFGNGEIERWGVGKDENGDDDSTIVVLWLDKNYSPENVTGGEMRVMVTPAPIYINASPVTVGVKDEAGPVIVSAECIKSLIPDGNDVLLIKMSETSSIPNGMGNLPFNFVVKQGGSLYTVSFADITLEDGVYKCIVSAKDSGKDGKISKGDSIFVNVNGNVKDINGVYQLIETNKRVEITMKTVIGLISAVYLDTNTVHDGYTDIIRIDLGMEVSQEFAERIAASIDLSSDRKFTVSGVKAVSNGIELSVVEEKKYHAKEGYSLVKTNIDLSSDSVWLKTPILSDDGLLTVDASKTVVTDGVAPVVSHGIYDVGVNETTLEVVFSEPVDLKSYATDKPYKFLATKLGDEFTMTFAPSLPVQGKSADRWIYKIESKSIAYPVKGDSLWIAFDGIVFDLEGNKQDLTVRAPLLADSYPFELDLYVVPQPMSLIKLGDKRYEPKDLNDNLADYYKIPSSMRKGVAIVLEAKGPITDVSLQKGVVKIIDQTGNLVTDEISMKFDMTDRGTVAGVAVWDGKNRSGRTIGAATYLAIVEVEVKFDDRDAKESRAYRRAIMVTSGGDALK